MQRPEFFEAVAARWNVIRHVEIAETIERIRTTATRYQSEFEREFERHVNPAEFNRPELKELTTFMENVEYLANWLTARAVWLDGFFNGEFPEYCSLWRLVEFYKYESHIGTAIDDEFIGFAMPLIRLPYATKIELQDAIRIFSLEILQQDSANIKMRYADKTITHRIGSSIFNVNESVFYAAAMSLNIQGFTYIPLRAIAEILGYEVGWLEDERTVLLTSV
jgi:hypothetical protein